MAQEEHDKKTRAKFVRFLKENKAFSSFIRYFHSPDETKLRKVWCDSAESLFPIKTNASFKDYCDKCVIKQELLQFAFSWDNTKEGFNFWNKLSEKWRLKK